MKSIFYTRQFKKDIRLAEKRRKDIVALKHVLAALVGGHLLPAKYQDHSLRGPFTGYRECHIEPDWLLIYKTSESEIRFVRTGTHADLFG